MMIVCIKIDIFKFFCTNEVVIQDWNLFFKRKLSCEEAATSALASSIAAHTAPIARRVTVNALPPDGLAVEPVAVS